MNWLMPLKQWLANCFDPFMGDAENQLAIQTPFQNLRFDALSAVRRKVAQLANGHSGLFNFLKRASISQRSCGAIRSLGIEKLKRLS